MKVKFVMMAQDEEEGEEGEDYVDKVIRSLPDDTTKLVSNHLKDVLVGVCTHTHTHTTHTVHMHPVLCCVMLCCVVLCCVVLCCVVLLLMCHLLLVQSGGKVSQREQQRQAQLEDNYNTVWSGADTDGQVEEEEEGGS